jgi:4-hydroxy-tetrahydrodipicolinate reductase
MKIALIGYGKMGKMIEECVHKKEQDEIVLKISKMNPLDFSEENLQEVDVAIEFTTPHTAVENILKCADAGIPVVCGTTGWLEELEKVKDYIKQKKGALIYGSNFSLGVNIFFELNRKLAALMNAHMEYDVHIEEKHHTEKKDAPSGTAISLANDILKINSAKSKWIYPPSADKNFLSIDAGRKDTISGIHYVCYRSANDEISIRHEAFSRKGFAEGALLAARWIAGKKGIFEFKEIFEEL